MKMELHYVERPDRYFNHLIFKKINLKSIRLADQLDRFLQ